MAKSKVRLLIWPTVTYLGLMTAVLYLFYYQRIIVPLDYLGRGTTMDLSYLLTPSIALITFNYIAGIIERVFVGELVEPLARGLKRIAATSAALLFAQAYITGWIPYVTLFLFNASLLTTLHSTLVAYLRRYNVVFDPVLTSLYILFVGYLGSQTWLNVYPFIERGVSAAPLSSFLVSFFRSGLAEPVNMVIIMSTAVAAFFSLLGVFRSHPNPNLRFIGRTLGTGLDRKVIYTFFLSYYLLFVRKYLMESSGFNPQYIVVAEWAGICLLFYVSYKRFRDYTQDSLLMADLHGTWQKHLQQIEQVTDYKLDHVSSLVEQFIQQGTREELIVHLALVMDRAEYSEQRIRDVLDELINYQDLRPGKIAFSWQVERLGKVNMRRRSEILNRVLGSIQLKLCARVTLKEDEKPEPPLEVIE